MNGLCSFKRQKSYGDSDFLKIGIFQFFFQFFNFKKFPYSEMDSPIKKSFFQNVLPFSKTYLCQKFHVDWPIFTMKILCLKFIS